MSLCDDCDNEDCDLNLTGETESCDDYLVLDDDIDPDDETGDNDPDYEE